MKKILLLVCLLVLAGCAKQPVIANLNPFLGEQPPGIYRSGSTAVISGQDARKTAEVIVYHSDDPATRLANSDAPPILISARLADGFRDQGLDIQPSSPVHLKFVINELSVQVSHQKMLYTANAKTHIAFTVESRGTVFTKVFKREANNDSATRPRLPELERMLNEQLANIMMQITQDEEIRALVARQ